jgi:hypothetical protein
MEQRARCLDAFIKGIGKYQFLFDSFEFMLFVRYSEDDLSKQIKALLQLSPGAILEKYQSVVKIDL